MGIFDLKGSAPTSSNQNNQGNRNPFRRNVAQSNSVPSPAPPNPPKASQPLSPPQPPIPSEAPPPYHDWTVIPDTSTLPPPPSVRHEQSSTTNASRSEADRAHEWCRANPLLFPHQPLPAHTNAVLTGHVDLMKAQEYKGNLTQTGIGAWTGSSKSNTQDASLFTSLPLYFALTDSPTRSGRPKTIYYEVEIRSMGTAGFNEESSVALGYCALPQPSWRMPGWERASLGVHSDDGHRYVSDPWGGKDFTAPFGAGDTIGLGMTFKIPENPPEYEASSTPAKVQISVEIFLTRNGRKDGVWDIHEQLDLERDQPVDGLDGLFDLYGSVGIFGAAEFVVKLKREDWLWRPH